MGDRVIPGFYYDREKGRYFKIRDDPSGAQNCYTTESIRKQQLAIKLANLKKDIDKRNLNKNISCRLNTLLHLAQRSQQCGKITPNQSQTFGFTNMKSAVLTQFKTGKVSVGNSLRLHDGRILLKSYGPSTNQQTHLTIYDLDIENSPSCSKPKELFICKDFYLGSRNCMTELRPDVILVSGPGEPGDPASYYSHSFMCIEKLVSPSTSKQYTNFRCGSQKGSIMDLITPSLQSNKVLSAILRCSGQTCVSLLDGTTLKSITQKIIAKRSRSLKLAAHVSNPDVTFAGTGKGELVVVDCRESASHQPCYRFKGHQPECIRSLVAVQNEYHLVTSLAKGSKCLFDTRVQNVITTNEEVVSDIDLDSCVLKTDELKTYISASYQRGGFVRIWDSRNLQTCHILELPESVGMNYVCEMTTHYGHLSIMTVDSESIKLHS